MNISYAAQAKIVAVLRESKADYFHIDTAGKIPSFSCKFSGDLTNDIIISSNVAANIDLVYDEFLLDFCYTTENFIVRAK